jgi:alkylation response protein AidB-like acyl-CoA dehydrogenase
MHGCGLRIGEALAVNLRCRINRGEGTNQIQRMVMARQLLKG